MEIRRKPAWLQKKVSPAAHADMARLLGELQLHTVCQEAACPNITECFRQHQATFLILGKDCTRHCTFCNLDRQTPLLSDADEPARVAEAVARLGLVHVVVTSPTRDDLPDGGAGLFALTVAAIRARSESTRVELLVPDFGGDRAAITAVAASGPDILGHNVETVPRLYTIRTGADYRRSLAVLATVREVGENIPTKSGLMVGLGETEAEVLAVFRDLRKAGCNYLSVGQYLAPSRRHQPVVEFVPPERFERYRTLALALGFRHVEAGPYVRSSYHAADYGE